MNIEPENIRPMPYALGPEKAVLSVILQYPERLDDAPELTQDHFYLPGHRLLFESMRTRIAAGQSIELVTLTQALINRDSLDRIGGPSAMTDIYTYQASPEHFGDHVGILAKMKARRMAIAAGNEIIRTAYESEELADLLEATSTPISDIHDALVGNREAQSTKSVLQTALGRFQELCEGKAEPIGIQTSLAEIDRRFRGLHPRQTIVISGYPGGGKTTLATQLAIDAAMGDHNAHIVSLEMPAATMMQRILAYVSRRPAEAITDPLKYCREHHDAKGPTNELIQAIRRASEQISKMPLAIEDLTGANVHQIAACIRRAHRKKPLDVVVVDFAQRIRPVSEMRKESREQQLAHASNHLADISKELGFCLLLPSQLNKEGAAKHAEAINEDADLHLSIAQDRGGPNPSFKHIGVAVMKDRHNGQDGQMLPIVLDGPMLRFIPKPFES